MNAFSAIAATALYAVVPFLAQADFADIREIAPVQNWGVRLAFLCAAFTLLGCIWLLFRKKPESARRPIPEAAHVKAARLLDDLRKKTALTDEVFTVQVSEVLRRYLEEALQIPAPEQTSEEFLRELRGQPWLTPELQTELEEFVRLADLVKFARRPLNPDERTLLLDRAKQAIRATEPKPEPISAA